MWPNRGETHVSSTDIGRRSAAAHANRFRGCAGAATLRPSRRRAFRRCPMTVLTQPLATLHPARRGPRPMNAEDLWSLPRVGTPQPAPDGRFAIVPVTTYDIEKNEPRTRLWRVALDGHAEPLALTSAESSAGDPRVSPDGRRVAFTRKDGNGKA